MSTIKINTINTTSNTFADSKCKDSIAFSSAPLKQLKNDMEV